MKKRIVTFALTCSFILCSCGLPVRSVDVRGSGSSITESRSIAGFNEIELSSIGTLIIEQGDAEALEITAEDNILKHLRSQIIGSQLRLEVEDLVNIHPTQDIIYRLKVKNLNQIGLSGLGIIESKKLISDNLTIQISGGGRISIDNLQAKILNIDLSGLGDISVTGSAEQQNVNISGAGNYNAPNLASQQAKVIISGSGKAIIWATEKIDSEISGAGILNYFGSPILNSKISGLGVVKNLGNK